MPPSTRRNDRSTMFPRQPLNKAHTEHASIPVVGVDELVQFPRLASADFCFLLAKFLKPIELLIKGDRDVLFLINCSPPLQARRCTE